MKSSCCWRFVLGSALLLYTASAKSKNDKKDDEDTKKNFTDHASGAMYIATIICSVIVGFLIVALVLIVSCVKLLRTNAKFRAFVLKWCNECCGSGLTSRKNKSSNETTPEPSVQIKITPATALPSKGLCKTERSTSASSLKSSTSDSVEESVSTSDVPSVVETQPQISPDSGITPVEELPPTTAAPVEHTSPASSGSSIESRVAPRPHTAALARPDTRRGRASSAYRRDSQARGASSASPTPSSVSQAILEIDEENDDLPPPLRSLTKMTDINDRRPTNTSTAD